MADADPVRTYRVTYPSGATERFRADLLVFTGTHVRLVGPTPDGGRGTVFWSAVTPGLHIAPLDAICPAEEA